jgi:hypothetical protein
MQHVVLPDDEAPGAAGEEGGTVQQCAGQRGVFSGSLDADDIRALFA